MKNLLEDHSRHCVPGVGGYNGLTGNELGTSEEIGKELRRCRVQKRSHSPLQAMLANGLDSAVGNLTNALAAKGVPANTVFIYAPHNGSGFPYRGVKGNLFEGGVLGARGPVPGSSIRR
jgi:hypothetical protein